MLVRLPLALERAHESALAAWRTRRGTERLFARDAGLWTGGDEASWLGWLDAPEAALARLDLWRDLAADAQRAGCEHFVLLGMGGSSLGAEVLRRVFGRRAGHPEPVILDSTDPDQIRAVERRIDPARTLVVVASKSGSTLEPNLLAARFLQVVGGALGARAGERFVAVTDPGSKLEALARERGFRHVVLGEPTIGGRFSALSPFGLVPAALQGLDVAALLEAALAAAIEAPRPEPAENRAVRLGLLLGAAAERGVDKLTLVAAPELEAFGAWLEQLVAESTGKRGRAVLPFDGEQLGRPDGYGADRLFVALRFRGALGAENEAALAELASARRPIVEIDLARREELAAAIYRWEIATAVAGAVLGVHPFDQPDVEAAKVAARKLTAAVEATGALPAETPLATAGPLALYADPALASSLPPDCDFAAALAAHFARFGPGDYFALLAFLEMAPETAAPLERLRHRVRDARRVATALGFGPRFLHSTGQAHKGGPPTGVFLVITADPRQDLPVPGQRLSFGQVIAAQARGDFEVLCARGRRALRVHLAGDPVAALERLDAAVAAALAPPS
jgi:transaldolase/glucose-6-phosphate isomerase